MTDEESELRKSWVIEIEKNKELTAEVAKLRAALTAIAEYTMSADINSIVEKALGKKEDGQ